MAKQFKTRFIDVDLNQKEFSPTSVRAIKEIYATKNGLGAHEIKNLDFRVCKNFLTLEKEKQTMISIMRSMSPNGNIINS
jgi:hypothetical protein